MGTLDRFMSAQKNVGLHFRGAASVACAYTFDGQTPFIQVVAAVEVSMLPRVGGTPKRVPNVRSSRLVLRHESTLASRLSRGPAFLNVTRAGTRLNQYVAAGENVT